jgi:hypothetical protein
LNRGGGRAINTLNRRRISRLLFDSHILVKEKAQRGRWLTSPLFYLSGSHFFLSGEGLQLVFLLSQGKLEHRFVLVPRRVKGAFLRIVPANVLQEGRRRDRSTVLLRVTDLERSGIAFPDRADCDLAVVLVPKEQDVFDSILAKNASCGGIQTNSTGLSNANTGNSESSGLLLKNLVRHRVLLRLSRRHDMLNPSLLSRRLCSSTWSLGAWFDVGQERVRCVRR